MGNLRVIAEFIIVCSFSLFLFIVPYSRRWGKYSLIASLVLVMVFRFLAHKRRLRPALGLALSSRVPLILCLCACIAGIAFSNDPYQSQKIFVSRYLFFFITAWAGFVLGRDFILRHIKFLAWVIMGISLYMASGGMRDYSVMSIQEPRLWTIWGRYTAFNMLPLYLASFMCFNYSFLAFWGRNALRWPALINTWLFVPVIIWQQCRSAYPAVAGGLILVNFFRNKKLFLAACGVIIVLVVSLAAVSDPFRAQLADYLDMDKWDNRLPLFHSALKMFRDRPAVGIGIGMFEHLIRTAPYEPPADYMPQYRDFFIHTHSFYLETLAETGLIGIAVFAVIFALFFRALARKLRAATDDTLRPLLAGCGAVIVVYLVFGITLSLITVGLNESAVFWLFFGLAWGLIKREVEHG